MLLKNELDFTSKFKKDYKLLKKQGKDMQKLSAVLDMLACGEKLSGRYLDHALVGEYNKYRECHIEPDWLLIYRIKGSVVILYRMGSHSQLFI